MNFHCFFYWNALFLKDFFSCYRILGFVFYIFKKDIISLTAGLYRLREVIWIMFPLCVMCHFPLCAFKIFLLPLVFSCLSMMSLGIVFFVLILFGVLWASEICTLMPFTKFQKTLAIISSDIFSALTSPSGVPSSHMLNLLILSYRSLALLFIFNLFFFQFFRLDNFYCSLTLFSVLSILLLSLSIKCLFRDIAFFNSRIFL